MNATTTEKMNASVHYDLVISAVRAELDEETLLDFDTMPFERFLCLHAAVPRPDGQRKGQWLFNHMLFVRPDVANTLRGSLSDPFYRDQNTTAFLAKAAKLW
jgi:hypothetical protein